MPPAWHSASTVGLGARWARPMLLSVGIIGVSPGHKTAVFSLWRAENELEQQQALGPAAHPALFSTLQREKTALHREKTAVLRPRETPIILSV